MYGSMWHPVNDVLSGHWLADLGCLITPVRPQSDWAQGSRKKHSDNKNVIALGEPVLDSAKKMDQFLASVEVKAFRIARLSVRHDDEALDIVQDTMMKLVQKYADKSETDWPGLFFTILNSRINDWHRRSKVRNRWRAWLGKSDYDEEGAYDPIDAAPDLNQVAPEEHLMFQESAHQVECALRNLPLRQRQAFLLRMWEGMSVEQTAIAMGCSQGSVKTHCARALEKLKVALSFDPSDK